MKKIINFFSTTKQKIGDFLFKNRFGTIMILTGIIVAFWDFTTKFLFDGQEYTALKGVFSIFSTHNTGGAWSIFANATWLLILFSILFIIGIVVFNYFLKTKTYFYAISMGILLSGAICNLYDRIAFGYVRDFIKLDFMNFPIFNIADIAICVGVALIAIYFIFIAPKLERQQKLAKEENVEQTVIDEENQSVITEQDITTLEQNKTTKEEQEINNNTLVIVEENNEQKNVELENKQTEKKSSKKTNKKKTANEQNSLSKNKTKTTSNNIKSSIRASNKTTETKTSKAKNSTQTKKQSSKKVKTDNAE